MSVKINTLKVLEKIQHLEDIYELILENPNTHKVLPCQFYNLGIQNQGSPILKRPISVSQVSERGIHFVIKKMGRGTERLCDLSVNDEVLSVGPLGNGYDLETSLKTKKLLLIGGGIGTAPLLQVAKEASLKNIEVTTVLGYQKETYLVEAFAKYSSEIHLCTMEENMDLNDTYKEEKFTVSLGNTVELTKKLRLNLSEYTIVACGPDIMLEKTKEAFDGLADQLYLVTEERMACGMGACLVCAKKVIQDDTEKMVRTCVEGPVFLGSEVQF